MSSSCYLPEVMGYSPKYPVYPEDLGSDLKKHDLKRALINKRASSHPRRPMCQTPPTLCDIWDLLSEFFFFPFPLLSASRSAERGCYFSNNQRKFVEENRSDSERWSHLWHMCWGADRFDFSSLSFWRLTISYLLSWGVCSSDANSYQLCRHGNKVLNAINSFYSLFISWHEMFPGELIQFFFSAFSWLFPWNKADIIFTQSCQNAAMCYHPFTDIHLVTHIWLPALWLRTSLHKKMFVFQAVEP